MSIIGMYDKYSEKGRGQMGKKNKRTDRYERTDFSSLLTNNPKTNKNVMKKGCIEMAENKKVTTRPAPMVADETKDICDMFVDQAEDYINGKIDIKGLFNLNGYHTINDDYPDKHFYMVNRNVRANRETGALMRASANVVILKDGIPCYFVDVFMNSNMIYNVQVIPLSDATGANYRDSARATNRSYSSSSAE